ncbi:MAG: dacB [Haloplasmataceae bacterium]|jgi:D-alanyl-D-alanine carboxypeptidase|nr:dacB [Haloplasmataceae bacterium]
MTLLFTLCTISINSKAQIDVSAQSAMLLNSNTGRILFEKDAYTPRPIASLTKVMTAMIALESVGLDDEVVISATAANQPPSSCPLEAGDTLTMRQLLYCLLLRSGNDAAYAIAEYVGGNVTNFVRLMNNKAAALGLDQTNFTNPSGLDDPASNTSTAYDLALLMRYAMTNGDFRVIAGTENYRTKSQAYQIPYNWNHKHRLVTSTDWVIAGKTGFTRKAGRTLISVARRDNRELIAVTLNDPNDWEDHVNMFEYGFNL